MKPAGFALCWPCEPQLGQGHWKWCKVVEVNGAYKQKRYVKRMFEKLVHYVHQQRSCHAKQPAGWQGRQMHTADYIDMLLLWIKIQPCKVLLADNLLCKKKTKSAVSFNKHIWKNSFIYKKFAKEVLFSHTPVTFDWRSKSSKLRLNDRVKAVCNHAPPCWPSG